MKINYNFSAWRALSEKLNSFLSAPKKALFSQKKWLNNRFLSWPEMPKRKLCAQAGYSLSPKIDVKVIEKFLYNYKTLEEMHPMMSRSFDDWYNSNVHKKLAVEEMVELIGDTISDIKSVELIHICHKKG